MIVYQSNFMLASYRIDYIANTLYDGVSQSNFMIASYRTDYVAESYKMPVRDCGYSLCGSDPAVLRVPLTSCPPVDSW